MLLKRMFNRHLALLFVVAMLGCALLVDDVEYPVSKIVDGDTIRIDYLGKNERVRLIGVDTPEPVEQFGEAASSFTRNLLIGESVNLRFDTPKRDRYGRLLAYVYRAPDGLFVNLEIIRQGYGRVLDTFPFKYQQQFQDAENRARPPRKGLWNITP